MITKSKTFIWIGGLSALCLFTPMSAQAGFEWSPPASNPTPRVVPQPDMQVPSAPAVPAPMVEPTPTFVPEPILAPAPVQAPVIMSAPVVDLPPTQPRRTKPSDRPNGLGAFMKAPSDPAPVMAPPAKTLFINPYPNRLDAPAAAVQNSDVAQFDAVQGFGKDLPLVIAMSQVIPANYTYSFSDEIDMGARVSWSGGKAWPDVLSEMLEQEGLRYNLASRTVHIASADEQIENVVHRAQRAAPVIAAYAPDAVVPPRALPQRAVVMAPTITAEVSPAPVIPLIEPATLPVATPIIAAPPVLVSAPSASPQAPNPVVSSAPAMISRASDVVPDRVRTDMSAGYERPIIAARISRSVPDESMLLPPVLDAPVNVSVPAPELRVPDAVLQSPVLADKPPQPPVKSDGVSEASNYVANNAPTPIVHAPEIIERPVLQSAPVVDDMPSVPSAPIEVSKPQSILRSAPAPVVVEASPVLPVVSSAPLLPAAPVLQSPPALPLKREPMMVGISVRDMLDRPRTWRAVRGDSLKTVLTDWSTDAGVELYWSSEFDYPLDSSVKMTGTFEDAVQNILTGLQNARPRPAARLHPNEPGGPAVLVVETQQVIE